jgi:hypothetical protein
MANWVGTLLEFAGDILQVESASAGSEASLSGTIYDEVLAMDPASAHATAPDVEDPWWNNDIDIAWETVIAASEEQYALPSWPTRIAGTELEEDLTWPTIISITKALTLWLPTFIYEQAEYTKQYTTCVAGQSDEYGTSFGTEIQPVYNVHVTIPFQSYIADYSIYHFTAPTTIDEYKEYTVSLPTSINTMDVYGLSFDTLIQTDVAETLSWPTTVSAVALDEDLMYNTEITGSISLGVSWPTVIISSSVDVIVVEVT